MYKNAGVGNENVLRELAFKLKKITLFVYILCVYLRRKT